jgi:hypothetical protein
MTSATSNDNGALVKTAAARVGFSSLFHEAISTTRILTPDFLPEPGDLGRLRAVSKDMRDAVDATGREIKKLSNLEAAELGYLSLLKDRRTRGLPSYFWEEELRFGCLPEKWHWERGNCPWDKYTCSYAARGGQLEVLKWLREDDCPWDKYTCSAAADGGHLEILQWARENGCPWNEWTCAYAAEGGHLETLKWLRENGCPWDEWTCVYAAHRGNLEVLKWARENSCPWDELTRQRAASKGYVEEA